MKVLVLGATGSVGSAVVQTLLKGGASVAALTRSAEKAKALPAGVEARIGDLNDPYHVGAAFKGVDAVFLLNAVSSTETQEGLFALEWAKLQGVKKLGTHGVGFSYKTINTDTLGWIIRRVTGLSLADHLSQRIWSRLGAEHDAYITVDTAGNEFAGGGLNTTLRDLARFGELMRNGGHAGGAQVLPKEVVDDIRRGADPAKFTPAGYVTLPGWSYRNMWWVSHNPHGAYMARGVHGQAIYIDPAAQMVIARYASHPVAGNVGIDPHSLPAYHALARYLCALG